MARERYLVGVSEEELRPDPKPEGPKTPKGKLENYWYHYKWHTIGGLFAAIVLIVTIGSMLSRNDPDYTLLMVTQNYYSEVAYDKLEAELSKYGSDLDGDGVVEVSIQPIYLNDTGSEMGLAQRTKLTAHLAAGDIMFFAFDAKSFEETIISQQTDDFRFFAPLDVPSDAINTEQNYYNWKSDAVRGDEAIKTLPEDLYFGVRVASGTAKKGVEMNEQCMALLKAFITKTLLTKTTTAQ